MKCTVVRMRVIVSCRSPHGERGLKLVAIKGQAVAAVALLMESVD